MKKIHTKEAYIKLGANLFHLIKREKNLTQVLGFLKKKGEFGSLKNESLSFKWDTPIMFISPKVLLFKTPLMNIYLVKFN